MEWSLAKERKRWRWLTPFFPTVTEIKKSNTVAQLTIREFVTLINATSVDPRLLYSSLLFPPTPVPTYRCDRFFHQ